jgi:hypothetical protein
MRVLVEVTWSISGTGVGRREENVASGEGDAIGGKGEWRTGVSGSKWRYWVSG